MMRSLGGLPPAMDHALLPSTVRNCHERHKCALLSLQFPAVTHLTAR